jgi:hypothetical protein
MLTSVRTLQCLEAFLLPNVYSRNQMKHQQSFPGPKHERDLGTAMKYSIDWSIFLTDRHGFFRRD